jgi:hypothetical protein
MRDHDANLALIQNQRAAIEAELGTGEGHDSSLGNEEAVADDHTTFPTSEGFERLVRELRAQVRRLKSTLAYPHGRVHDKGANRWNLRAEASIGALLLGIVVAGFDFRTGVVLLLVALYLRIGVS